MEFVNCVFAASWPVSAGLLMVGVAVAWTAFWTYVWCRYFPILLRLIDQQPLPASKPGEPLDGGEECEFPTRDGLTLRGTYLRTTADRRLGVILFAHELFGDRWTASPYVRELLREGYDILTFDLRNHGTSDSDRTYTPRPWVSNLDVLDIRSACEYLSGRADADPRGVGMLGVSRGGGAMLCAAAGDSRVRCVVTDGAYPSRTTHLFYQRRYAEIYVPRAWRWLCRRIPDWAYGLMLAVAFRKLGKRSGVRFVNVERAAARIGRPVLLIHGERDTIIPLEVAKTFKEQIGGDAKLWVVPEARHNAAVESASGEYQCRLSRFFGQHVAPPVREPLRQSIEPVAAA